MVLKVWFIGFIWAFAGSEMQPSNIGALRDYQHYFGAHI